MHVNMNLQPHICTPLHGTCSFLLYLLGFIYRMGRGPRVVVSTTAFHARAGGLFPGLGGLKETRMFLPYPLVTLSIVGSLRDREVACSASDRVCISNHVSGGQCHLVHLTILRRLSWPNLACMCTKVTYVVIYYYK